MFLDIAVQAREKSSGWLKLMYLMCIVELIRELNSSQSLNNFDNFLKTFANFYVGD